MRNRVIADAVIVAEQGPTGTTRLPVLRSQAPLVLRRTPESVYLVGAAAGPIAGDRLSLTITVGPGAFLRMRTSAACVALPGRGDAESVFAVTADVAPGGRLEYLPEPTVVAAGARHATQFRVTLAAGAELLLRDELILGRHGEPGGRSRGVLSVDYAGRPLLRHALEVSGGDEVSRGPAVLAGHRAVGTLLHAGAGVEAGRGVARPGVAVMPLAGPGVLVTALANDAVTLRRLLCVIDSMSLARSQPRGFP